MTHMKVFCTFHIWSDSQSALSENLLNLQAESEFDFVDNHSIDRQFRRARFRKKLGLDDAPIPRYHWKLCSNGFVEADDLHLHLQWVLGHIQANTPLSQLLGEEFTYWVSVFWGGNGTGGGPLIDMQITDLLAYHRLEMGVSFYLETESEED